MANRATVPKFGAWDGDRAGYTVYFEKVRQNKGATAPPLLVRPPNPSEPEESLPRVIAPPSRPATSSGHHHHHHHGAGSSVAHHHHHGGGEQSKFAPPPQFLPRLHPSSHHSSSGPSGGSHQSQQAAPHNNALPMQGRPRGSAVVPRFGVWDELSASDAAQGFTVRFDNLKRHREAARISIPDLPRPLSPESESARRARHTPLVSKMFGCFTPHDKE